MRGTNRAAKTAIAKAAVKLIQPKQVIILDGGTSTQELVKHLPLELELTVVTHSPTIAVALMEHRNIEVIMLGGKLFKHSMVNVGAAAMEAISHIRADLYFMGVNGIDKTKGLTIRNYEESILKQQMMAAAKSTICCVVEEKIDVVEAYQICPIENINTLITNIEPDSISLIGYERVERV